MLTDPLWSPHWFLRNTSMTMDYCKKNITPLLTHWSYIFLALTHRHILLFETRFLLSHVNRVGMALSGCWGACIGPELAWDRCPLIHEFNWTVVQDESVSHVHFIVLGSVWPSVTSFTTIYLSGLKLTISFNFFHLFGCPEVSVHFLPNNSLHRLYTQWVHLL